MPRYSDYDDDDDERRPPKSSGAGKPLLIVFGIIGGIVLILVVGCGTIFYFVYRGVSGVVASVKSSIDDIQASQMAADNFMSDVAQGGQRLDNAYKNTTKNYQSQQTPAQFKDFVQKNPGLKSYQPMSLQPITFTSTASSFQGQIPGQIPKFTLQVVKEGETWKVDRFTIP
jgi:hypothetical protein